VDYTQPDVPIDMDLQRKLYEDFSGRSMGTPWFGAS